MKKKRTRESEPVPDVEVTSFKLHGTVESMVDAVIQIGQERRRILASMKEALLRGDDDEALERARELTGLPTKQPTNVRVGNDASVGL
jgi:hypothetical protein